MIPVDRRQPTRIVGEVDPRAAVAVGASGHAVFGEAEGEGTDASHARDRAIVVLVAAVVVLGFVMAQTDWWNDLPVDWSNHASVTEYSLAASAATAAFVTVSARQRLTAIISIGVIGIIVTLFFVCFDAPYLALSQFLVDILTVVQLILVFS